MNNILNILVLCFQDNRTPLCWASSAGSADACEALIKTGADMETADKDGLTRKIPLFYFHTFCMNTTF